MNYKYIIIGVASGIVLVSGLGCVAAVSQAKISETDVTESENVPVAENQSAYGNNVTDFDEVVSRENTDFYAGAGIQLFLGGQGEFVLQDCDQPETIAVLSENVLITELGSIEALSQEESEYADLAIANVNHYVNVRTEPNTGSAIVGKIYNGAVAQIMSVVAGEDGDWFQVVSGNVEGYTKSEFFLYGDAALEVIDDCVTRYATVIADRLNVRVNPDIKSSRVGYVDKGERVKILENLGEWLQVQYTNNTTGYVSAEYVTISEEFIYAKSLEEEARELAERKALEERQRQSETQAAENTAITVTPPNTTYSTNSELRQQIIEYAMQYLGNKYIHGGKTLAGGTDCSGFTSLVYAEFGYSLSRTPEGQLANAGRGISYSEAQPGDIICYGSNGRCTHVAFYIGDGQILHSATPRDGVVIGRADFDPILSVRNVID